MEHVSPTAIAKLAAFALVLAALVAGGIVLGRAVDPSRSTAAPGVGHGAGSGSHVGR